MRFRWLAAAALLGLIGGMIRSRVAWATTFEALQARLAEVEPLRELRVEKAAPRPGPAELRRVAQGSIVTGMIGRKAWAAAVVDLPIGRFWAGLNDETRHPGYTAVAYSELISGSPCRSNRRVFQYLPLPFVADRWWIGILYQNAKLERASGGAVRELFWRSSTDPNEVTSPAARRIIEDAVPIGSTRGGWFLVALDPYHTYVEYYSNTDPGPGVPSSLTSRLAERGVRDTVQAMVRFAKEGHPVCPVY